jgi:hypothetical protein
MFGRTKDLFGMLEKDTFGAGWKNIGCTKKRMSKLWEEINDIKK